MSYITACIFDLDGVIVDTAKYHYQAWNSIAKELGFEFTWEENEMLKGVSRPDSLEVILRIGNVQISEERKKELLIKKNDIYLDLIKNMDASEILPGVKEFLIDLKNEGLKIGLGSASRNALKILKTVDLMQYFDSVVDGNGVSKSKPNPEVFLKGAEELDEKPANCIVFEDSKSGVKAANDGGFYSVGIGKDDILQNAKIVLPGFEDITYKSLLERI